MSERAPSTESHAGATLDPVRDILLVVSGQHDDGEIIREIAVASLLSFARVTGRTLRELLEQLFIDAPTDEHWRDEILPALDRRAAALTAELVRANDL